MSVGALVDSLQSGSSLRDRRLLDLLMLLLGRLILVLRLRALILSDRRRDVCLVRRVALPYAVLLRGLVVPVLRLLGGRMGDGVRGALVLLLLARVLRDRVRQVGQAG